MRLNCDEAEVQGTYTGSLRSTVRSFNGSRTELGASRRFLQPETTIWAFSDIPKWLFCRILLLCWLLKMRSSEKIPSPVAIPCRPLSRWYIYAEQFFRVPEALLLGRNSLIAVYTGGSSDADSRTRRGRRQRWADEFDVGDRKQSLSSVVLSLEPVLIQTSNYCDDVSLHASHIHTATHGLKLPRVAYQHICDCIWQRVTRAK